MKTRLSLLACCLLAFAVQAQDTKVQMWKWTDANGVVHYSDVPGPGAVMVDVNVAHGQPAATSSSRGEGQAEGEDAPPPAAAAGTYSSLKIVKPENGASYFEADAVVDVQMSSSPNLADGDSIYLYLDGNRVGNSGRALGYSLHNIDRGEHSLSSVIVDQYGKEKIRSEPVVFYMKQPGVNSPAAVGPAMTPRPKPRSRAGG
jgi:hypothetical protein